MNTTTKITKHHDGRYCVYSDNSNFYKMYTGSGEYISEGRGYLANFH